MILFGLGLTALGGLVLFIDSNGWAVPEAKSQGQTFVVIGVMAFMAGWIF